MQVSCGLPWLSCSWAYSFITARPGCTKLARNFPEEIDLGCLYLWSSPSYLISMKTTQTELLAIIETYEGMIRQGNAPAYVYEAWTAAKARLALGGR